MSRPWPVPPGLSAELLALGEWPAFRPHWDDLSSRALEPNAFFTADALNARSRHLPGGADLRLLVAWRGDGETRRLVGLLPVLRPRGRVLNPFPIRRAPELYGPLSTPLVDPDRPDETWAAMLAGLAQVGAAGILLPFLSEDGPVAAALVEAAGTGGLPVEKLGGHGRAFLDSRLGSEAYFRATLETRRRKEAERQRRRLGEQGKLTFCVANLPEDVTAATEEFIALEAAGWKGRAGTDLGSAAGASAYFREIAAGMRDRSYRVATLRLDGRAIAAGLVMIAGRRAFYVKTAYDEALARFSPGLLLTLDLTAHLLDDPSLDEADSVAVADHPMIDRLWTGRFRVASLLVATRPGGGPAFRSALAFETLREGAIVRAKRYATKLSRSRPPGANETGRKAGLEPAA